VTARARPVIAGLLSLAVLAAVVVGLPLVLYRLGGSPLPRQLPGWRHVAAVLRSPDNGALALAAARDAGWLGWLLFAVSVLAETQAAIRGRAARRLRLGGLQGAAARLVALIAVTFVTPAAVTLTASGTALAVTGHSATPAGTTDLTATTRIVTVRPGDCLWAIAQHYLGAGDRYPEIAALNYGREMGDGQVFTNPALIDPGWHLRLPAAVSHAPTPAAGPPHHLGHASTDAHYRRYHAGAMRRVPDDASRQERAGGPSRPSGASSTQGPVPGASGAAAARNGYQAQAGAGTKPAGDQIGQAETFVAGAVSGSVLAGFVLASLSRLRGRQRQYRRRGRRIPLPADPDVLAMERRLRAVAPALATSTLREALACLQAGIAASGQALPDIIGLHITPAVLEVLLSAPAPDSPPAPYAITPGRQGMCWQLDLPPAPAAAAAACRCDLLPGLFTAGATADGYLLLDLETLKVTGCDGPADLIDQVITAAATELAAGQWSGWYELILVGGGGLEVLGRAQLCDNLDDALDLLDTRSATLRRRLASLPPCDVRELRLAAPDDEDWGLQILVSRMQPTPEQLARLLELTEDGPGGIAALIAGDPEAPDGRMTPTVLQLAPWFPDGIVANVVPLQITVRPQVLSAADYQAITTLFAVAADEGDVSPDDEPYQMYAAPPCIPQSAAADAAADCDPDGSPVSDGGLGYDDELDGHGMTGGDPADGYLTDAFRPDPLAGQPSTARPLAVGILGPFLIDGGLEPLQPKQAELVLALALAAPASLSNSELGSMLGADPDHPKPGDAVRQIISRTRRRLGQARDGLEYVVHTGNGNYVLHQDASLDWTQFRSLVGSGHRADLRAALSLVRGQPFAGCFFWWVDIPLLETVRAEVVDAAETLAELELSAGSARAAARAARAGLTAEASAEQLWRLLMRAEHAGGNLAGVTEAWQRCLDAIEEVSPGGEPHPDTSALYHRLTTLSRPSMPV
jgi:DNA-binding SARP family transcriptional activator